MEQEMDQGAREGLNSEFKGEMSGCHCAMNVIARVQVHGQPQYDVEAHQCEVLQKGREIF